MSLCVQTCNVLNILAAALTYGSFFYTFFLKKKIGLFILGFLRREDPINPLKKYKKKKAVLLFMQQFKKKKK